MAFLKHSTSNKNVYRVLAAAGALIVITLAMQMWFVQNARSVLKKYIAEQSKGKIELELSKLDVSLWSNRLQILEADLFSTDTLNEPITYRVTFSSVSVKVGSFWKLLVDKKLELDSLKLYNPVIQVIQWRKDTSRVVTTNELSIPQEMGKVYNTLLNALNEFAVRRIIIDNASITLVNKTSPGVEPVTVSRIFLDLARKPVRHGNTFVFLNEQQTVDLRTSRQQIALPGGRHHISFKSFRLQLFREIIELDSCTLTALATDSLKSSYRVFFNKLSLTGVDFNALSAKNVIKADSVYCDNPFFELNLYRSDAVKIKTDIPDPNKIIRELTGNLDLAFVGVKNAGIHFDIYGKTKRSFFNSNKDNFEISGFRVNPDSASAVSIKRFDMTLRDYYLFNEDSSSVFSFDSLHFLNDKIVLHDFAFMSNSGKKKLRNLVDIRVPRFQLSQLDWYQLIFEQNLIAKEAVLNNPVINFTRRKPGVTGKKLDLFDALLNLDSLVALDNVLMTNGQVNGRLGPTTSFNVQNINFNIYSNKLLGSTNKEGVRNAVDHLSFTRGLLRLNDITAQLQHARYTGKNLIYARKVDISGPGKQITSTVSNVLINNLQLDDNADNMEVDGLSWDSAKVAFKSFPSGKMGSGKNSIYLKNVVGYNTQLNFSNGLAFVSTFLDTLNAVSVVKKGKSPARVEGLFVTGNRLMIKNNALTLRANSYKLSGNDSSSLSGLEVQKINRKDTLHLSTSFVQFTIDFNDLFANVQHLSYVYAQAPVLRFSRWDTTRASPDTNVSASPIFIDQLIATEPDITIHSHVKDSVSSLRIPWSDNSIFQANGIVISGNGMQLESMRVNTTAATFVKNSGRPIGVEKGKIDLEVSDVRLVKNQGKISWSGFINTMSLEQANGFHWGKRKNQIQFRQFLVGNLRVASNFLPGFNKAIKANASAWLRIPQLDFSDSVTTLRGYNANYVNSTGTLRLDSFVYHPTKSLSEVLATAPYQLDYITAKTGAITIAGIDLARYESDSSVVAGKIEIEQPVLTVYRDKKPPSSPSKKSRPLPVNMITLIPFPVSVKRINFTEGSITYKEKNRVSGKQGDLLLTKVNGAVKNIKNREIRNDDSLAITFNANLMDATPFYVSMKQSYTDSLNTFVLNARVNPAQLSMLNPFLVPVLNVKISSGLVDSGSFRIIGRQDISLGEMRMHYRALRIALVKNGDERQIGMLNSVLGFIVNTFVIRSKSNNRQASIYYKRTEGQSFVNYIIKSTLSGISNTVGLKSNRRYGKQYRRDLRNSKAPGIKL